MHLFGFIGLNSFEHLSCASYDLKHVLPEEKMAHSQELSDNVIVYPPGCREISEEMGTDELIRRLKVSIVD